MPAKKKASTKGQKKVAKVMHEFKHGQLKSGGRKKVTNPKQAIAIGLSEARRSGADIPDRRPAAKRKSAAAKKKSSAANKKTSTKRAR